MESGVARGELALPIRAALVDTLSRHRAAARLPGGAALVDAVREPVAVDRLATGAAKADLLVDAGPALNQAASACVPALLSTLRATAASSGVSAGPEHAKRGGSDDDECNRKHVRSRSRPPRGA